MLSALPALLLVASSALPAQDSTSRPPQPRHLAEVLWERGQLDDLRALDLDVIEVEPGLALVVVDDAELDRLARAGLKTRVVTPDLATFYEERLSAPMVSLGPGSLGAWLSPPFAQGGMGGYYTFPQIESVLDQMTAAYPALITARQSLGQTIQGRDIWMVKISDNPGVDEGEPEVRIDALHHAREPQGMQTTLWFMLFLLENYGSDPLATYLVDEREMYFVPCVNPDGYEYNRQTNPGGGGLWRKNRRSNGGGSFGVDLNRNYPYNWGIDDLGSSSDPDSEVYRGTSGLSEPESQAIESFMGSRDFRTALSVHTFGGYWLAPWGYADLAPPDAAEFDELGALATEINGYEFGPGGGVLYLANGVTPDTDYGVHDTFSWTPEIGNSSDGFWPSQSRIVPLAELNLLAFQRTALAAGPWVRAQGLALADAGDGDGFFEAGETVDVTALLRNSGRGASGLGDVQLVAVSPEGVVQSGMTAAPALASFSDGQNATPLELGIVPGTPAGTLVEFQVVVTYGGLPQTLDGSLVVGEEVPVAVFDFEAAGDQGWSVGNPNDASTGEWERGNPVGTEAQPEDDHTPGGGNTDCWFTGQGAVGGGLGDNDVDGGSTTLVSPVFDLSSGDAPRVSYWRWYSNDTGAEPNADVFQVDLSNDGGSSWTNVETVGPTGAETSGGWREFSFAVESVLPATDQVRLRFIASDLAGGSIVEAAVDDLSVTVFAEGDCTSPATYCTTAANSVGAGATLSSSGTTSIAANDLVLEMSGGLPGGFGLYFYGPTQIQAPFGDGFRCVGGATHRMQPPLASDGSGANVRPVDFTSPPTGGGGPGTIQPDSTWFFQYWYRDPMGPGGTGFNLSDGLAVTFCD